MPPFYHSPRPLPRHGDLGLYNESLAAVKEHIHRMQHKPAVLEWLNEVQRCLNRARRAAEESFYEGETRDTDDTGDTCDSSS